MIQNNVIKNNFWTPIVFDKSFIQKKNCLSRFFIQLGSLADRYVHLGNVKINASTLEKMPIKYPVLKTMLKIVSYVLTAFVSTLIALGMKAGYQYWAKKNLVLPEPSPLPKAEEPKNSKPIVDTAAKKEESSQSQGTKPQNTDSPAEPVVDRMRARMIKDLINKSVKSEEKEQHREMLVELANELPANTSLGKLIQQALVELDQEPKQPDNKRTLNPTFSITDLRKSDLKNRKRKAPGPRPMIARSESGNPYVLREVEADKDNVHNVALKDFLNGKTTNNDKSQLSKEPPTNKQEDAPTTNEEAFGTMCVK